MGFNAETLRVTSHSKKVGPGSVFVAIQGARDNGIYYIPEAIERGAHEIIIQQSVALEKSIMAVCIQRGIQVTRVDNPRRVLAQRAAQAYKYPADSLYCIGITGTKGKTTTAWLTYHMLQESGYAAALLSTVENRIGLQSYPTDLTTQPADYMHSFLSTCVQEGVTHVVIEVAAQALTHYRVSEIPFSQVAWLNFSQEHGEFYASEDDYWNAKLQLFDHVVSGGTIVIPSNPVFSKTQIRHDVNYKTWSNLAQNTTFLNNDPYVTCLYSDREFVCPKLLGKHNSDNLLVALMLAHTAGASLQSLSHSLESFSGIPGRLNWYKLPNWAQACIDYAHNPASFEATLSSLRQCTHHLIVVFGAGGERDGARRPIMGSIAARYADHVVLTTDNPRSEDPHAICNDIIKGIGKDDFCKVTLELDREKAIRKAYLLSKDQTIIALLGKGPDEYQLINGIKHPFSEKNILMSL